MNPKAATALLIAAGPFSWPGVALGGTTAFFDASLAMTNVASGETSETDASAGYLFARTLDKWWYSSISIGPGTPTGRPERVLWPQGLEAQAITAGPSGLLTNQTGAKITVERADRTPFDITSFSAQLLASTAGAGASLEVMPKVQGEDALPDPLMYNATGFAGKTFTYQTPELAGFDSYDIKLWVDFALTALTVVDASPSAPPKMRISKAPANEIRVSWPADASGYMLEESPDVLPGHFTASGAPTSTEGNEVFVLLPSTDAARFWRLAK